MTDTPAFTPKPRHRNDLIAQGGPVGAIARLSSWSERRGAVLDVGVNRGTVAIHLCRLFGDLPVHLIEPIPEQCAYVRDRFVRFPTVQVHQLALGKINGTVDFHLADHIGSSSLYTNTGPEAAAHSRHKIARTFPVSVARLDDWCAAQGIAHIACMKIDAQGSEFDILTGAHDLLAGHRIDMIMLEWFSTAFYDDAPLLDQILTLMRGHGYTLYDIYPKKRLTNGVLLFGDAVFVSDGFRKTRMPTATMGRVAMPEDTAEPRDRRARRAARRAGIAGAGKPGQPA